MKTLTISCALVLALANIAHAGFEEVIDATCSVNRGSGVVFGQDQTHVWIISAAHCVLNEKEVLEDTYVRFFNTGKGSELMKAEVLWYKYSKGTTIDLAILKVEKKKFGSYPVPNPIPIASADKKVKTGDVVLSCGCPGKNYLDRNWPTAWKGHITSVSSRTFKFKPTPLPGRSGSGIFNKEGTHLIGIIIWRDGTTVPLDKIYDLTKWEK